MNALRACEQYVAYEAEYKRLGELIKHTWDKDKKKDMADKRRKIRTKQNLLYPNISGSGYTQMVIRRLGGKNNQMLYFRYRKQFGNLSDREKGEQTWQTE